MNLLALATGPILGWSVIGLMGLIYISFIHKREELRPHAMIVLATSVLSNFIFWFKDPEIGGGATALLGMIFLVIIIYLLNVDIQQVLYLFAVYVSFQKVLPGDFGGRIPMFNLTNILIVLLIGGWLSRTFTRGETVVRFFAIDLLVIVYILILGSALIRSEFKSFAVFNPMRVITDYKRLLEPFLVYLIFVNNIKDKKQVQLILLALVCVVGAAGVMGVKQYYMDIGGGTRSNMDKNKITILTDQPNQLATYFCSYAFYLGAVAAANWKKWWGWVAGLLFLFCIQSIRVTFSRGGLLGFYCGLLVFIIFTFRLKSIPVLLFVALSVFAFPEKVLGPRLYESYHRIFSDVPHEAFVAPAGQEGEMDLDQSAMSRWYIVQAGITRVREDATALMFGVGIGRFPYEILGRHPKVMFVDAHNQWLLILVECGIIALLSLWLIMAICALIAMRVYWITDDPVHRVIAIGYLAGLTGIFISNFFGSRMNSNEIILLHWIMTAVVLKLDVMERERRYLQEIERRRKAWVR
ncbi:MAG: O-antigen ligase family protein [Planctomycetota bacterium]